MPKFRTIYDVKQYKRCTAPVGSPIHVESGWIIDDGEYKFVAKRTYNLYEKIQAARDSCDLKAILARYEAGDNTALDRVQGTYFDLVNLPHNYTELYNAVQKCNDVYESMPIEIKNKYRNNAAYFWSKVGSKEFDQDIADYRTQIYNSRALVDPKPSVTAEEIKKVIADLVVESKGETK